MSPFIIVTSTCTLPLVKGRGFMLPLPLLGGMGAYPMPPKGWTWELIPCPPWLRKEGLIFAPPSPVSHSPPPLGYLPLSSPR